LAVFVVATLVAPIDSFAQNSASPSAPSQLTAPSGVSTPAPKQALSSKFKTWTRAQWKALKEYWSKSQEMWNDCIKQSQGRKMTNHQTKDFLYQCMQK
jgi:hypothetical protein